MKSKITVVCTLMCICASAIKCISNAIRGLSSCGIAPRHQTINSDFSKEHSTCVLIGLAVVDEMCIHYVQVDAEAI
jgi:GTP:adenosylcobinamide-phosphate guanylyltransferase